MTKLHTQKGFTLVELAIVMTIIGLLIGGILKGQELMENARVTATIAQVKAYEAATTTFRDSFSALPGDMANAQQRLPNCNNVRCNPTAGAATSGDSIVGLAAALSDAVNVSQASAGNGGLMAAPQMETVLFWLHLLKADLISGVSDAALNAASAAAWGETHPAGKIGGGFRVANGDGTVGAGNPSVLPTGPAGLTLILAGSPTVALGTGGGVQPMIPAKAAQIDRKMDDGNSRTGFVQAYGVAASCFQGGAPAVTYNETVTNKDCGLLFRIQG